MNGDRNECDVSGWIPSAVEWSPISLKLEVSLVSFSVVSIMNGICARAPSNDFRIFLVHFLFRFLSLFSAVKSQSSSCIEFRNRFFFLSSPLRLFFLLHFNFLLSFYLWAIATQLQCIVGLSFCHTKQRNNFYFYQIFWESFSRQLVNCSVYSHNVHLVAFELF